MAPFPKIYPLVSMVLRPTELQREAFPASGPSGVIVHYSADPDLARTLASDRQSGFCYHLIIDQKGLVTQTAYFDKGTWHAGGESRWLGQSPNSHYLSFCLLGWGVLKRSSSGASWISWTGKAVPDGEVAMRPDNVSGKMRAWQTATPAQEDALLQALKWAVANGIKPAAIADHSEVAEPKGRKLDVGGMIRWTMPELRALLAAKPAIA